MQSMIEILPSFQTPQTSVISRCGRPIIPWAGRQVNSPDFLCGLCPSVYWPTIEGGKGIPLAGQGSGRRQSGLQLRGLNGGKLD
jgi:hypothetical protein